MIKPRIAVLLAAYNGEKYLSQQLDSILLQTLPLDIFISVDHSSDDTYSIASMYSTMYENVYLLCNDPPSGSSCANFLNLLNIVDLSRYHYISFSDQDDIWLPDKIESGLKELTSSGCDIISTAMLPFSDTRQVKYNAINRPEYPISKYSFLLRSYGSACTTIISSSVARLVIERSSLLSSHQKSSLIYFDWLLSAVASFEQLKWRQSSYISMFYRQHRNNVLGASFGITAFTKRFLFLINGNYIHQISLLSHLSPGGTLNNLFSYSFNKRTVSCFYLCSTLLKEKQTIRSIVVSAFLISSIFKKVF